VIDYRIEGTVLVIRRTAKLNPYGPFLAELFFKFLYEAGFADARLTAEEHHLSFTCLGLRPASPQQPEFVFAAY